MKTTTRENKTTIFNGINNYCSCDRTDVSCDAYCCCDERCEYFYNGTAEWIKYNQCINGTRPLSQVDIGTCLNKDLHISKSDIQDPLRTWTQNLKLGLCVIFDNSGMSNVTGVPAYNKTQFQDKINQIYSRNTSIENLLHNMNQNIILNQGKTINKTFDKYKPSDPILIIKDITKLIDGTQRTAKEIVPLYLPATGPNGDCLKNYNYLKFMEPRQGKCAVKMKYNQENCNSYNDRYYEIEFELFNGLKVNETTTQRFIKPVTYFYDTSNKYSYILKGSSITNDNTKNQAGWYNIDSPICRCKNVIVDARYDFLMKDSTLVGLEVHYYLNNFEGSCSMKKPLVVPVSYNINFISADKNDYIKSGNPGYIMGKPLITGKLNQYIKLNNVTKVNDTTSYIDQYKDPRLFLGISNFQKNTTQIGSCFHADNDYRLPISPMIILSKSKLEDKNSKYGYYNSPNYNKEIDFNGGTTSVSCFDYFKKISLLEEFCNGQGWKNNELFTTFNGISHIGKFGNPNAHYIKDWIEVENFDNSVYNSVWDSNKLKCFTPSVLNVDILYATFGSTNNTQHSIIRVKKRMEYTNWYGQGNTEENPYKYHSYLMINYIRVPQETKYWFAPAPGLIKLPKNIMYPFKIGTTNYGNSSYLRIWTCYTLIILFVFVFDVFEGVVSE